MKYFLTVLLLLGLLVGCEREISIEERDKILTVAFKDIDSKNDVRIIRGVRAIKKYPTYSGLNKLVALWENDISRSVEDEVVEAIRNFEQFRRGHTLLQEIFDRNYSNNMLEQKKAKLRRLVQATDDKIKIKLLKKLE